MRDDEARGEEQGAVPCQEDVIPLGLGGSAAAPTPPAASSSLAGFCPNQRLISGPSSTSSSSRLSLVKPALRTAVKKSAPLLFLHVSDSG